MKKLFLAKQVHSCFASCSSGDVFLYRRVKSEKEVDTNEVKEVAEDRFVKIFYLEEDKTFYDKALTSGYFVGNSYEGTQEFKNLVNKYVKAGWTTKMPREIRAYHKQDTKKYYQARKTEGYVLYKPFEKLRPKDYRGGFSDKVVNHEHFKSYIKAFVFGYIGHSVRKSLLDRYIENKFLSLKPKVVVNLVDLLVDWLTSTDGRHFGDELDSSSFKEQKIKVDGHINEMLNLAYLWSKKEHIGTLASTSQLRKKHSQDLI